MKAIILAGGLGTRLRPVTYEIPKPLIPVKKKPVINHLIEFLSRNDIDNIGILANKDFEFDFQNWSKVWGKDLPRNFEIFYPLKRRGTFGELESLKEWLNNEDFVITNSDELKDFDLKKVVKFHKLNDSVVTAPLVRVKNPERYLVPILEGNRVIKLLVKAQNPPSNFIFSGLYVFSPKVFEYADFSQEIVNTEKDVLPQVMRDGKLLGYKLDWSRWYDCGDFEGWEKAIKEW